MIIETHAHLSHYKFENTVRCLAYDRDADAYGVFEADRAALLEALRARGVAAVVEPAIDIASNRRVLELAGAHPGWIFPAVGLHPTRTPNERWRDRAVLGELSAGDGVVAIGETGLDFHYPREQQHRLRQLRWFVYQILLAHRRKLPLILHIRDAHDMAIPVLRLFRPLLHGGVAHCFYGSWQTAEALLKLGFHLGIGGTLLQDSETGCALRETVKQVPLERILLETDAPYVHPSCDAVPSAKMRSKVRNTPLILPAVARKIAELKGLDPQAVEDQTAENAIRLFKLPLDRD